MLGSLVGDIMAGGALDPSVRDLHLVDNGGAQVGASYAVDGENGLDQYEVAMYVDGIASSVLPGAEVATTIGPLSEGNHDVDFVVQREEWFSTPRFRVDRQAGRGFVRWNPAEDADVVAYRIYRGDNEGGAVDYGTILGTVDAIEADTFERRPHNSGAGSGTASVLGNYNGPVTNALWRIKITADSLFDYDTGGGYTGTPLPYTPGLSRSLESGLSVCFPDPLGTYDPNDEWEFWVGPQLWFRTTGELDPGTYLFGVKAVDAAGNVSAAGDEVEAVITGEPEPVSGVAATYDPDDEEVTIAWTDGADTDVVRIYSSWDQTFGDLQEHILETGPIAEVAGGVETWTFAIPADSGTVRFYLRAVNSDGLVEENFSVVEVDTAAEATSLLVGSPFDLAGVPGPGGVAVLSWIYDTRDGMPDSWNVYTFTSEPDLADFLAATPTNLPVTFDTFLGDIGADSYTTGVLAGERWFGVRAVDENGAEDDNVLFVSVTPDADAPDAVTPIGAAGV